MTGNVRLIMKSRKIRYLAIVLSMIMLLGTATSAVFATEGLGDADTQTIVTDEQIAAEEDLADLVIPDEEVYEEDAVQFVDLEPVAAEPVDAVLGGDAAVNLKAGAAVATVYGFNLPITWAAVEGASRYTVKVNGQAYDAGAATSYTCADLQTLTSYEIKVTAFDAENKELTSASINFKQNPLPVTTLSAHYGYKSVTLRWTPVAGATSYIIQRAKASSKGTYEFQKEVTNVTPKSDKYSSCFLSYKNSVGNTTCRYYYKIIAVKDGVSSAPSAIVSACRVKPMQIKGTLKTSRTLTSHDKAHKTRTFPKGFKFVSYGVNQGRYIFDYKGNQFYVKDLSVTGQKAVFTKKYEYDRISAENYVNERDLGSKTKYLIWTSLFTQHTFVFKKVDGKWSCLKDFECASGSAKRPTPTGYKELWQHIAIRHSRKYWTSFSNINSYHAKLSKQTLGAPGSNGCVRMKVSAAKYIYDKIPLKTRAFLY